MTRTNPRTVPGRETQSYPHPPPPSLSQLSLSLRIQRQNTPTMSSSNDLTTPDKKRSPSYPAAPTKKMRSKNTQMAPTENPLLLISTNESGDIATYCSNHDVLSGISGHFGNIELFMSDELFESVLGVVGGNGYSSVNRDLYDAEQIAEFKKRALIKLFSLKIYGGGEAPTGEVFRGTVVV